MSNAKLIKIMLLGGDLHGLRVVDAGGRVQGILCPRPLFPDAKRKRKEYFDNPGVYLLTDTPGGGELPEVYVGMAVNVGGRIITQDYDRDFWDTLIFFNTMDRSLNEAHARYLESKLISLALEAKGCKLDNKQKPRPNISEMDTLLADNFLADIQLCMSVLGYRFLEMPEKPRGKKEEQEILYFKASGINATGYESSEGFVVKKGSEAVQKPRASLYDRYKGLREDLKKNGVFEEKEGKLVLTQDYTFSSPSAAASVFSGCVMNGLTSWINQKGVELKELQKRKAAL